MASNYQNVVTLKHLFINESKQIGMQFRPNKLIHTIIKTIPNIKWSNKYGMAYIKNTPSNLNIVFDYFNDLVWVNTSNFFDDKSILTLSIHM